MGFKRAGVGDCSCPDLGLYTDCDGQCFDDSYLGWVGDGYCDDGTYGLNLVCADWTNDLDDCEDGAGSRRYVPVMESEIADGYCDAYNNNPNATMMGATAVLQNVFPMPILARMILDSTIVRIPTQVKMTGLCRVMPHSATALRLAMVPVKSTVGRRSADGIQINRAYLIVAARS